jgi:hypothetical protein
MDQRKIFIVGCPRTGTKLMLSILNRSERVCIAPETHYFLDTISHFLGRPQHQPWGRALTEAEIDRLVQGVYGSRKISAYWQQLKRHLDPATFTARLLATDRSERAIFSLLLQLHAEQSWGEPQEGLILGEKTPAHIDYVPTLLAWFPEAKIIHTFRDPRAITVSRIKKVDNREIGLSYKYPGLPKWLADPLDPPYEVFHIGQVWLKAVRLHSQYEALYPHNYHMVRFEDLVTNPERQITAICQFLDIPFEPTMLEIVVVGSSYQAQKTGGFDTSALERWKAHLNPLARVWYATLAKKHLKRFGYTP